MLRSDHVSIRCAQKLSRALIGLMLLGGIVHSQDTDVFGPEVNGPTNELGDAERRAHPEQQVLELHGFIFAPDGTPAQNAVVASTAGGQAVTDSMGAFQLKLQVPAQATQLSLSARSDDQSLSSSMNVPIAGLSGAVPVGTLTLGASGICQPQWQFLPGELQIGVDREIRAMVVFNDGNGPALYAAGLFHYAQSQTVNYIARWNGTDWSPVGSGLDDAALALTVFDDGSGPALYVGGGFNNAGGVAADGIAKWDGSVWSGVGGGIDGPVRAMIPFDNGSGPALYAAGSFTSAGGVPANRIARWDGSDWQALGDGFGPNSASSNSVEALAVYDDGSGPALFAGGFFQVSGTTPLANVAKWENDTWSDVGSGTSGTVLAFANYDDGNGMALYAAGIFFSAGGAPANHIARWDGTNWSPLGQGVELLGSISIHQFPRALTVFDDGNGADLYAAGNFNGAGGAPANRIARWDGSSWTLPGNGLGVPNSSGNDTFALTVFDDGSGPDLYAGGTFFRSGETPLSNIARWDGSAWESPDDGWSNAQINALETFDEGNGPALFAGGMFQATDDLNILNIARWNGSNWTALGSGVSGTVQALLSFEDSGTSALFAAGSLSDASGVPVSGVARWDGSNWFAVGDELSGTVNALAIFNDGTGDALYAGGEISVNGGVGDVAKWDGSTWSAIGPEFNNTVFALASFDAGQGELLYAGGNSIFVGGNIIVALAQWDGSSWSPLTGSVNGNSVSGTIRALASFDDGSGPALYIGGAQMATAGIPTNRIARWDGVNVTPLGSGLDATVRDIDLIDDGTGPALCVAGDFVTAGGTAAMHLAKWDGANWSALGGGVNRPAQALSEFDDGSGPALHAGGPFTSVFESGDSYLGKWGCSDANPMVYCTAKPSSAGCVTMIFTSSPASQPVSGSNDYAVSAADVQEGKNGLLFVSITGAASIPFSGGTLCMSPPLKRGPLLFSGGDNPNECDGTYNTTVNDGLIVPLGLDPGSGNSAWYQYYYRDPLNGPAQLGSSLSNAVQLDFQ